MIFRTIASSFVLVFSMFAADQWWQWNRSNSPLPSDTITAIHRTPDGTLWIGTSKGLARYQQQLWSIFTTSNSELPDNWITALTSDPNGRLWIGTRNGIGVLYHGQWTRYQRQNSGLISNHIRDLTIAPDGSVWIATDSGISRWYRQRWISFTTQNSGLQSNNIRSIAIAADGTVWVGTENSGIAEFRRQQQWYSYTMANSPLPSNVILSLAVTADALWIGTWGQGLVRYHLNDASWQILTKENSPLPHNWITALASDPCGSIWIGTRSGGVARFDGHQWETWSPGSSPLPSATILSLFTNSTAQVWIGTPHGIAAIQLQTDFAVVLPDTLLDCSDPTLAGTIVTRGRFQSTNIFFLRIHQRNQIDTIAQFPTTCSIPFRIALSDLLDTSTFHLSVVSTAPPLLRFSAPLWMAAPQPIIRGDTTLCSGDTTTLQVEGPFVDYFWSTGDSTATILITRGGTYTVTVTDSNGCQSSRSWTITEYPRPAIVASSDTSICEGEPAQLRVSGGSQYLWQPAESLDDPTSATPLAFPTETTTYIVTGINEHGCANRDTVIVTVRPAPAPPQISRQGDTLICSEAASYQWYWNNTPIAGATSRWFIPTRSGSYKVRISDSTGCSAFSDSVVIILNSAIRSTAAPNIRLVLSGHQLHVHTSSVPFTLSIRDLCGRTLLRHHSQSPHTTIPLSPIAYAQPLLIELYTPQSRFHTLIFPK